MRYPSLILSANRLSIFSILCSHFAFITIRRSIAIIDNANANICQNKQNDKHLKRNRRHSKWCAAVTNSRGVASMRCAPWMNRRFGAQFKCTCDHRWCHSMRLKCLWGLASFRVINSSVWKGNLRRKCSLSGSNFFGMSDQAGDHCPQSNNIIIVIIQCRFQSNCTTQLASRISDNFNSAQRSHLSSQRCLSLRSEVIMNNWSRFGKRSRKSPSACLPPTISSAIAKRWQWLFLLKNGHRLTNDNVIEWNDSKIEQEQVNKSL